MSSICHGCASGHLQDLPSGWGTTSHLPNRGKIYYYHLKAYLRIQNIRSPVNPSDIGPQGGSTNGTADGLYHRKPQGTGNRRPVNRSILIPPENWGIHKTSEGERNGKLARAIISQQFRVKDSGFCKNGKFFQGMNH